MYVFNCLATYVFKRLARSITTTGASLSTTCPRSPGKPTAGFKMPQPLLGLVRFAATMILEVVDSSSWKETQRLLYGWKVGSSADKKETRKEGKRKRRGRKAEEREEEGRQKKEDRRKRTEEKKGKKKNCQCVLQPTKG